MRFKQLKIIIVLLSGFGLLGIQAQNAVLATGGNATGSGGSVSYSFGQVFYTTNTGANGSVMQGAQQPYEIYVVTELIEAKGINLFISAYPNPTTDYLILEVNASTSLNIQSIYYQLFDMSGKLLLNKKITDFKTSIFMTELFPASYFVHVIQGDKKVKSFKIIKK